MSIPEDGFPEILYVLLSANVQGPVIKAIIDALGENAPEQLANAVRMLDRRVKGDLRAIDSIAREEIPVLKMKDARNPRKQMDRIVRGLIRRTAQSVLGTRAAQDQQLPWKTALAANALDIIRVHGAVDVLQEFYKHRQISTHKAREQAQKTKVTKHGARNKVILAEARDYSFEGQRRQAEIASLHAKRKKNIEVSPAAARGILRRNKPPK